MSERNPIVLLHDMLDAAEVILQYTEEISFDEYIKDRKTQDAVLRNLTVLGEAAARVSPAFRDLYPMIEWRKIARSRNIVVHDYFDVDHEIVWRIIRDYLPPLIEQLKGVIAAHPHPAKREKS